MSSGAQANLTSAFYRPVRKTKLTGRGCPLAFDLFSFRALMIGALVALALHVGSLPCSNSGAIRGEPDSSRT
jgi:hypothetical protein